VNVGLFTIVLILALVVITTSATANSRVTSDDKSE
jgi:hypothetical protein